MTSSTDLRAQAEVYLHQAAYYYDETEELEKALLECDLALADAHNLRGIILARG